MPESTLRRYIAATFTEQRLEDKARDVVRPRQGPPGRGAGELSYSAQWRQRSTTGLQNLGSPDVGSEVG